MRRVRDRLSYGNVVATLALFIALGGTSYAVTQLPRNSVGAPQIKRWSRDRVRAASQRRLVARRARPLLARPRSRVEHPTGAARRRGSEGRSRRAGRRLTVPS